MSRGLFYSFVVACVCFCYSLSFSFILFNKRLNSYAELTKLSRTILYDIMSLRGSSSLHSLFLSLFPYLIITSFCIHCLLSLSNCFLNKFIGILLYNFINYYNTVCVCVCFMFSIWQAEVPSIVCNSARLGCLWIIQMYKNQTLFLSEVK